LERGDIRLHDQENQMREEGGGRGEDRWWPDTLYESYQQTANREGGEEIVTTL
jgi:hypothetical protein